MIRKPAVWLALLALALIVPACSLGSDIPSTGTGAADNRVLYADGFADPDSGWSNWQDETSTVLYQDGALHIQVDQPHFDSWSRPGKRYADTHIEVDTRAVAGPENNDFGIICRYRTGENFYALLATSDGYYGIVRMQEGQYAVLSGGQMQFSPAIARGKVDNHLRGDCTGKTLALYVNNQLLARVEDDAFSSGEVGLIVGAYDEGGVEVAFDNFIVLKP